MSAQGRCQPGRCLLGGVSPGDVWPGGMGCTPLRDNHFRSLYAFYLKAFLLFIGYQHMY